MQGELTGVPRKKTEKKKCPVNSLIISTTCYKGLDLQMGIKRIPSTAGDIWYSALSECAGFKQLVRCTSLASTGVHGILYISTIAKMHFNVVGKCHL